MSSSEPYMSVKDIHKSFAQTEVLKGISFDIAKGEAVCIIGPSGSGKSTLLRCLNGLATIDRGTVRVGTHDVHAIKTDAEKIALRKDVSMVFQQFNLFPHKTALENIMMAPIHVLKQDKAEVEERARALLAKVRLAGRENHYPGELSGGQQQRVAIARALVNEPQVLLADEPTGNLDSKTSIEVMGVFQKLNDQGITIVMVTHELDIAHYCKRDLILRDGVVVRDELVQDRSVAEQELQRLAEAEAKAKLIGNPVPAT